MTAAFIATAVSSAVLGGYLRGWWSRNSAAADAALDAGSTDDSTRVDALARAVGFCTDAPR